MFFFKRVLPFTLVILLIGIGAFAFLSSREPPSPVVTYKAVTLDKQPESNCGSCGCGSGQLNIELSQEKVGEVSEVITSERGTSDVESTGASAFENPLSDMETDETYRNHQSSDLGPSEITGHSDETEFSDVGHTLESIFGENLQNLVSDLKNKYPLLFISQEDIPELVKTPGGVQEFKHQASGFSEDILNYLEDKFSQLPPETQDEIFLTAEQQIVQYSSEISPEVLIHVFEKIKQRLSR